MKNFLLILCTSLMISCGSNSENKKNSTDFLKSVQGTWNVSEINTISKEDFLNSERTPFLKIEESKVSGKNGCNNYFSSINFINHKDIAFSVFGETKMMCENMKIADAFNLSFSKVNSYSIVGNTLTFFNSEEKKLLVFIKA